MPIAPPDDLAPSLYQQQIYQSTPPLKPQSYQGQYQPQSDFRASDVYGQPSSTEMIPSSSYDPPSYEPPATSSYDPPSYDPKAPPASEFPVDEKRKKKFFMDDDDEDFEARAAALRNEEKAKKNREAEEAFKRAAEADGKSRKVPIRSILS